MITEHLIQAKGTSLPDLKKMRMTRDLKRANGVATASGALRRPAQQQLTLTCTRRCVASLRPALMRPARQRPGRRRLGHHHSSDDAAGIVALAGYGEGTRMRTSGTSGILGWSSGAQRRQSVLGSRVMHVRLVWCRWARKGVREKTQTQRRLRGRRNGELGPCKNPYL